MTRLQRRECFLCRVAHSLLFTTVSLIPQHYLNKAAIWQMDAEKKWPAQRRAEMLADLAAMEAVRTAARTAEENGHSLAQAIIHGYGALAELYPDIRA